jgi:hypothetical protein
VNVGSGQKAFVATAEKALLDLVYLTPGADNYDFLLELRLQNLESLDRKALARLVQVSRSPKLRRAVRLLGRLMDEEGGQEP